METLELILAGQVRALAGDLMSAARSHYYASIYADFNEAERAAKLEKWHEEHTFESYVKQALQEFQRTAALIKHGT